LDRKLGGLVTAVMKIRESDVTDFIELKANVFNSILFIKHS